jgi:branched-chain amino acid transport system ATP-binding protein
MADPVLKAEGLTKRFGGLMAVEAVDFAVRPGELHAVIGPNGAGKSTLLNLIAGDLRPSAGQVMLGRDDITSLPVEARARMGLGRTYQRSAVIPGFTALDMVEVAAARHVHPVWKLLRPIERLPEVTSRAQSALDMVGLSERSHVGIDVLSHGERRRVEIASVLALEPSIVLLDEPLAGLGLDEARSIASLIERLRHRCAVVLIEHDVEVVFSIADYITVLDNGRTIMAGKPDDVRGSSAAQRAYLGEDDRTMVADDATSKP